MGLDGPGFPSELSGELKDDHVMKTLAFRVCLFTSLGLASLVSFNAAGQTPAPATTETATPAKLPYGVEDVLKLSRAQISEDVTVNFIRNSGTIYNLAPTDIVYLRNQGVSDGVINTMLDQRKNVPAEAAAQAATSAAPPAPPAPAYPDAGAAQSAPAVVQPAPVCAQPDYVPPSTVYVIPYASSGYGYANGYPYNGGYYGYGGPSVVVGIGYGRGGRYGGYHGGGYGGNRGGGHYRNYGRR